MTSQADFGGELPLDTFPRERPPQVRPEHLSKYAVIYVRVSSADQVKKSIGSIAVQKSLVEVARRWGWPARLIKLIDDDLGMSAKSVYRRTGFAKATDLIDRGVVGAFFTVNQSRSSRDPLDAEILLTKAIRSGVLICANGKVYDTKTKDLMELFGLRIQNLIAWLDNETRAATFAAAKRAMIAKGYAVSRPPIGYIEIVRGKWRMDPDLEVQEAVRRVFRLYRQLGSVGKVAKYHHHHSLLFPRRVDGAVRWDPISPMQVAHLLTNPNYTDAYVYYRQKVSEADESRPRTVQRLPQSDWLVVHKHHDAYVTWEEWEEIQALLASHRVTKRPPTGNGPALLQGILWCERCKRWIRTIYP